MVNQKNSLFDKSSSKVLKDWLEEDNKEFQVVHKAIVKRKEWMHKYEGVIYLHTIFWSSLIWGLIDSLSK